MGLGFESSGSLFGFYVTDSKERYWFFRVKKYNENRILLDQSGPNMKDTLGKRN